MKALKLLAAIATTLLSWSCAQDRGPLAGNGSETTTGIAARVVDSVGAPAPGTVVELRPADWKPDTAGTLTDPVRTAVAGADGSVEFLDVPRGNWRLSAATGSLAAASGTVSSGSPGSLATLRLLRSGSLRGKVLLPVGATHAWVGVAGLDVLERTDASGTFSLTSVPSTEVLVEALVPGSTQRRSARLASVPVGGNLDLGELSPVGRDGLAPGSWTDSVRIVLDPGPGDSGEVLQGYPLLVRLSEASFDFSRSRGADLRFERAGRVLPHQVEHWDAVARTAIVWVRLDSVALGSGPIALLLRYGNPSSPDWSDGASVFPESDGWRGVWHLAATAPGHDATSAARHGTDFRTLDAEGAIGRGRFCDTGWILVPDQDALEPSALTISAWARRKGSQVRNAKILSKGNLADWHNSWSLQAYDSTARFGFLAVRTDSVRDTLRPPAPLPDGAWTLVSASWDPAGGTLRLFADGVAIDSSTRMEAFENFAAMDMPLFLGANFIGTLDEPRVSSVPRPPSWMRLDWATQRPGSTALRFVR